MSHASLFTSPFCIKSNLGAIAMAPANRFATLPLIYNMHSNALPVVEYRCGLHYALVCQYTAVVPSDYQADALVSLYLQ